MQLSMTNLFVFDKALSRKKVDQIETLYQCICQIQCSANEDIEEMLKDAWGNEIPETIDIYNVGHGNADYIRGEKSRILYDVGYNYRCRPRIHDRRFPRAINAIRYMKPSMVILSHWDMDHFIACTCAKKELFQVEWIAPQLCGASGKLPGVNARRIAGYLLLSGKLHLVDRSQGPAVIAKIDCAQGVKISLELGGGNEKLSASNREGLYIKIDGGGRMPNVLLAGDVPYRCMLEDLSEPIQFMHVPHHCSKMELDKMKNAGWKGGAAVISVDTSNKVMVDHYNILCGQFNEVKFTHGNLSDPSGCLSIQIKYKENKCVLR